MADDLTFLTLDVEDPADAPRLRGFMKAVSRAFQDGRPDDDRAARWVRHLRADSMVVRGAWPAAGELDPATIPVATFCSWDGDVNVGGGRLLPLRMITDVTVAPTHRRQGLMARLMTEELADAVAQGLPLAALTVSEGSIYGRFGFGPATRWRRVEVDTTTRFALRPGAPVADGALVVLDPTDGDAGADATEAVFASFHAATRGSVSRPAFYRDFVRDAFDFESGSPDGELHLCVHTDAHERPDGYVSFRYDGESDGRQVVRVRGLTATSPAVELRLWRFLADLDLCERVVVRGLPVEHPLQWAVTDPRVVRTTGAGDMLWLRVLDVAAALAARPWGADGSAVVEVADPLGHAAGQWRVTTADGAAEVSATEDDADLVLGVETLGSLYLGDVTTATLASAGRLTGSPGALETWAAMADTGPAPYCITGF